MRSVARLASIAGLVCAAAWAQTDQGRITGTVLDPTGAAVAAATIEVRNQDTGAVSRVGASNTGNYVVVVPTGTYELDVTASGFKRFVRQNIIVPVATAVGVDANLEVGAASDSVTVVDSAPLLKTESGEMSHNVSTDSLDSLPVLQVATAIRSPYAALNLLPGTSWVNNFDVRINGMPSNTQSMKIDGQDATNSVWQVQTGQTQPSVDSVQEVAIQTSNYSAEFGQAGGAVLNLTMRSGTNKFHGSAYDYMTNEDLNAGLPYTNSNGHHITNRSRLNDYGFTLGGPVLIPKVYDGHDKTFFFFNWEQWRNNQFVATGLATVPTAGLAGGDFSLANQGYSTTPRLVTDSTGKVVTDALGQNIYQGEIFDPLTDQPAGTARVRTPFPNNAIPTSRMDPVALKIASYFPQPNRPGVFQNYAIPTYNNDVVQSIPGFKIDQNLSATQKISIYYSLNRQTSPGNNGMPAPINGVIPQDQRTHTARINYDYTVKPTLLLHMGIGLQHIVVNSQPTQFDATTIGFNGQYSKFFPYITGTATNGGTNGGFSFGLGAMGPQVIYYLTNDKPTANTSLTWVKANHTYKFGGELVINGFPTQAATYSNTNNAFSNAETNSSYLLSVIGANTQAGSNYASFLLGGVDSGSIGPTSDSRLGQHSIGLFAQDTWKVNRKLTVDYGLRWDFQTYLKEQYGRVANFSASTFNPTVGLPGGVAFEGSGTGRCNCDYARNYPYAFGPRIGIAYQFDQKTVLRGGFGISYSKTGEDGLLSQSVGGLNPFATPVQDQAFYTLSAGVPQSLRNLPFPNFNPGQYPAVVNGVPNLGSFPSFVIDRNAGRPARIAQWSIGVQRQLTNTMVVEANYVGNRGVWWQANTFGYNLMSPAALTALGWNLNSSSDLTELGQTVGAWLGKDPRVKLPFSTFPLTQTVFQSLRPFPQFAFSLAPLWAPTGKNWYDSLQAKFTKRFSHGFEGQTAFTWQKTLDIGAENSYPLGAAFGGGPTAVSNNVFNYASNKFLSKDDRPFQLVISGSYTTPRWNVNKIVSEVVRNWRIAAVLRYQSGALIQIPGTNNGLAGILGTGTYSVRVPGVNPFLQDPNCHCFDPTTQLLLNPAAFTQAAPGQFSPSTPFYGDYRWMRQPSENLSIGRIFGFAKDDRYKLEVRAEFTNILNRHYYPLPSSTSLTTATTCSTGTVTPGSATPCQAGATLTGGYGFSNTANGAGALPRAGQIVARFSF
jgi:hypothetical protein